MTTYPNDKTAHTAGTNGDNDINELRTQFNLLVDAVRVMAGQVDTAITGTIAASIFASTATAPVCKIAHII